MIVGSTKIDYEFLRRNYKNVENIKRYIVGCIPERFRHVRQIYDNQTYYVCMCLRKVGITDYKELHATLHSLLSGVKITGYVDFVVECEFLLQLSNKDKLNLYLERL